jgi:hypothetical protein
MTRGILGGFTLLLTALALLSITRKNKSQPRWAMSFALLILASAALSACGSLPKSPGGQATPPGNYALIVTATAPNGGISTVNLNLNVQP